MKINERSINISLSLITCNLIIGDECENEVLSQS